MIDLNPDERQSTLTSLSKVISTCFGFSALILALVSIAFYVLCKDGSNNEQLGMVQFILKNSGSSPIGQIILRDTNCDINEELLELYTWKGTVEGCSCQNVVQSQNCVSQCQQILMSYKQTINNWKGSVFCVIRSKSMQTQNGGCLNSFKLCSKNTCVPNNEVCPITKLEIVPLKDLKNGDQSIQLNSEEKLIIWRESTSIGLYTLSVQIDNLPCYDPSQDPPIIKGSKYPLYQSSNQCGDSGQDTANSDVIDEMSYLEFLYNNQMERVVQQLNGFLSYANNQIAMLFSRRQIMIDQFNPNCASFDIIMLKRSDLIANNILNIGLVLLILKIVFGTFFIFMLGIETCYHKGRFQRYIPVLSWLLQAFAYFLNLLVMTEGAAERDQYDEKVNIMNYYKSFGENKCFSDQIVNNYFSNFPNVFSSDLENYDVVLYVCLCWGAVQSIILSFIYFFQICFWCGRQKSLNLFSDSDNDDESQRYRKLKEKRKKKSQNFNADNNNGQMSQPINIELKKKNRYNK